MGLQLLKTLGQIAGIAGITVGTSFLLFQSLLKKIVAPKLTPAQWFRVILVFMALVWSVAIAGIGASIWAGRAAHEKEPDPSASMQAQRLAFFSGSWRARREQTMQWTGGACATSDVRETLVNDLVITAVGQNTEEASGRDQHAFSGQVIRDGTPNHDCRFWQSNRPDYSFTSLRSVALRCDAGKDCTMQLKHVDCTGDCIEDAKQQVMHFVIPEGKRTTGGFLAVRIAEETTSVINEDVTSYKFTQE